MKLLLFNKPFDVLCQFTDQEQRATLADYISEPGYYAAGRLDRDSEGLVVLTDNGRLQQQIANPRYGKSKHYMVQVDGAIDHQAIENLRRGVQLKDGRTAPARARPAEEPDWLWPRDPPIRMRKSIPTSWLSLTITEGRNRQIRRMTAAVGFPTLRLIRVAVGDWQLHDDQDLLQPGQTRWHNIQN